MIVPTRTFSWWQLKILCFCDNELYLCKLWSGTWFSSTVPRIKLTNSYYSFIELTIVIYWCVQIRTIVSVNSHMYVVATGWISSGYVCVNLCNRRLHCSYSTHHRSSQSSYNSAQKYLFSVCVINSLLRMAFITIYH